MSESMLSVWLMPGYFVGVSCAGLQVAMGMQQRITAGREQVDSLQGRIQQQEAAMEELYQVHIRAVQTKEKKMYSHISSCPSSVEHAPACCQAS